MMLDLVQIQVGINYFILLGNYNFNTSAIILIYKQITFYLNKLTPIQ